MEALGAKAPVGFSCEKIKGKQEFIAQVVQTKMQAVHCIFEEMMDLPSGVGPCYHHKAEGTDCTVSMTGDVFVCGFSCKDLSRLNNSHSPAKRTRILEDGIGSTGGTFQALLGHVRRARPPCLLLENVDELTKQTDQGANPNLEYLWESFGKIDYFGTSLTMKTNKKTTSNRNKKRISNKYIYIYI